jgi:hypothetical protein
MDPFIEARGLWTDFHDNLIVELRRVLNASLPSRYEALIEERTYIDVVEPIDGSRSQHVVRPDVRIDAQVVAQGGAWSADPAQTALLEPLIMHPQMNVEEIETYIEVRDSAGGDRVVTCIEVLSPANKRPGSPGWGEYERKRQLMFRGAANFVEIDLLRGGKRRAMREPWPASPYYVLVMRQAQAPECRVFSAFSASPLPVFPVPLSPPDDDLLLELQPAVDAVLASSRYERRLRYGDPIEPPLTDAEQALLTNGR